jgi:hypothetical protein
MCIVHSPLRDATTPYTVRYALLVFNRLMNITQLLLELKHLIRYSNV